MSKIVTFLLGSLLGLVIGGALVFFFFGGAPRAAEAPPGIPILPPDASGMPPGTAQIVLKQEFFNQVLQTIFRDMNAPAFPLNLTGQTNLEDPDVVRYGLLQSENQCEGKITLLPEGSGVQTGLRFENNNLAAPLAFSGSTSVLGNCIQFTGWAQANLQLRYDAEQQTVFGQINVETVNLDGITPIISGFVTPIVQGTLNQRVNPIQILQGKQIALKMPIAATNSVLQANVKDVRAEVKDNALNLYVIYDFTGTPAG
ncbi:MAG: hypothetical protein JWN60_2694 [Acidobacteria bacterium]|jgi:hypothetical protein|nr:hypothetical protein [Acidobacteriota bacterium]